jgi:hypothetical protein
MAENAHHSGKMVDARYHANARRVLKDKLLQIETGNVSNVAREERFDIRDHTIRLPAWVETGTELRSHQRIEPPGLAGPPDQFRSVNHHSCEMHELVQTNR